MCSESTHTTAQIQASLFSQGLVFTSHHHQSAPSHSSTPSSSVGVEGRSSVPQHKLGSVSHFLFRSKVKSFWKLSEAALVELYKTSAQVWNAEYLGLKPARSAVHTAPFNLMPQSCSDPGAPLNLVNSKTRRGQSRNLKAYYHASSSETRFSFYQFFLNQEIMGGFHLTEMCKSTYIRLWAIAFSDNSI